MASALDVSHADTVARIPRVRRWLDVAESVIPIVALLVLVAYFGVTSPAFLTRANFLALTQLIGPLLFVSLGATFVVTMGSIDLSVGSVAMLSGSVCALLLASGAQALFVVPLALALGAVCGLVSGVTFAYGRVPSFIVTLGTLSVYRGLGLKLINGSPVPFNSPPFSNLSIGQFVPSVANMSLWGLVAWAIAVCMCFSTRFGRYMYAIGGSERVAQLSGVAVDRYKVYAFIFSGITAAFAGLLSVGQLSSADPTLGSSFLLDSLAAIVVGGTPLTGGVGGVHRTMLGVLTISILDDGLNLRGVDEFTQEVIKGAVVVIAAAIVMFNLRKSIVK